MVPVSPEIQAALETSNTFRTEILDLNAYPDLIAGQSVVIIDGERWGVLRYERTGSLRVSAVLVPLTTLSELAAQE